MYLCGVFRITLSIAAKPFIVANSAETRSFHPSKIEGSQRFDCFQLDELVKLPSLKVSDAFSPASIYTE